MINYNNLKDIMIHKNFDLLHALINYPQIDIYLRDYTTVDNAPDNTPQDNPNVDLDDIATDEYQYIQTVDCVYTFDKFMIANDDDGASYTFDVYCRYDDILPIVLENKSSLAIKFDGVMYTDINTINNLYKIVVQFVING